MGLIASPDTKHYLGHDLYTHVTQVIDKTTVKDQPEYGEPKAYTFKIGENDTIMLAKNLLFLEGLNTNFDSATAAKTAGAEVAVAARLRVKTLAGESVLEPVYAIKNGIEFRYDAVVLCAWMAAWGALAHPTPGRLRIVGALIVVLALHQTKGLLYAAALTLITWAINNRQEPKSWRQVLIGALMAAVPWFSLLLAQGLLDEQVAVYAQFARLRTELGAPAWTELLAQLRNDTYWWALAAAATAMAIRRQILGSALHITSIMAIPPIAFILVHPHPWPYMLVPCIPLLSSLCITALATRPKTFTMFAACLTLAVFAMPHHIHALQADGRDDLQLLAQLRAVQTSDDRVLDPSGAAYFIKPATPDWYLDGLFRHRLAQGTWHPAPENPESLPQFVLRSYRLDWMDSFSPDLLGQHYENACHWLWIKKGDPRAKTLRKQCPSTGDDSLLNYWQIQP